MSGFISPPGGVNFLTAFAFIASGGSLVAAGAQNITSVTAGGVGNYFVDYTAAGFTDPPQVFFELMQDAGAVHRYQYLVSATNTVAEIQIYDAVNAPVDNRVRFFAIGV